MQSANAVGGVGFRMMNRIFRIGMKSAHQERSSWSESPDHPVDARFLRWEIRENSHGEGAHHVLRNTGLLTLKRKGRDAQKAAESKRRIV